MSQGVGVVGLYVRDQDEALQFYVEKLGFRVHTDAKNGDYRWLTVQHPDQPSFQLGLFTPGPPAVDAATAQSLRERPLWVRGRGFPRSFRQRLEDDPGEENIMSIRRFHRRTSARLRDEGAATLRSGAVAM